VNRARLLALGLALLAQGCGGGASTARTACDVRDVVCSACDATDRACEEPEPEPSE